MGAQSYFCLNIGLFEFTKDNDSAKCKKKDANKCLCTHTVIMHPTNL